MADFGERMTVSQLKTVAIRMTPNLYVDGATLVGIHSFERVAGNTALVKYTDGTRILIFHRTAVLRWLPDGSLDINAWDSMTTRKRINDYLPPGLRIAVVDGNQWLVDSRHGRTWDNAQWHRGDAFRIDPKDEVYGGDAWSVGQPIKRNRVAERLSINAPVVADNSKLVN